VSVISSLLRFNSNGIEITTLHTDHAANAGLIINVMDLPALAADRIDRTVTGTDRTAQEVSSMTSSITCSKVISNST